MACAVCVLVPPPVAAQMMQQGPQINPVPAPTPTPALPPYVPPAQSDQGDQGYRQPPPVYIPPLFIPEFVPTPYTPATPAPRPPQFPMQAQQPVLPPVFRGCWQGTVEQVDEIRRLPGAHKLGYWTPKTYRLCYRRVGNGPYDLTFGETAVVASEKIKYSRGRVTVLQTDGRTSAKLHAFLYFDEYRAGSGPGGPTCSVDEDTTLNCTIDGDSMRVNAAVYGRREDQPWFRAHWHAIFNHVPQ